MPVLHMDTEAVRGVGNQLGQSAESLRQQSQQLRSVTGRLMGEWQGGSASMFESEMLALLQRVGQSAESGASLHQRLDREIQQWLMVSQSLGSTSIGNPAQFVTGIVDFIKSLGNSSVNLINLLNAEQGKLLDLYNSGQIGWNQLLKGINQIDALLAPRYYQNEGQFQQQMWADQWGGENWNASLEAGVIDASGYYNATISKDGIDAKFGGEVGIYAVRAEYNAEVAGVNVALDGYIGAQAKGDASILIDSSGVAVAAGGSAFVGGRIDASASKEVELAGIKATGEARGSVSYGVGATAQIDGGYRDGSLKFDVDVGATLGVGMEIGFSVDLDIGGAVDNVTKAGSDAINWGKNAFGRGIKKIRF